MTIKELYDYAVKNDCLDYSISYVDYSSDWGEIPVSNIEYVYDRDKEIVLR